MKYDRMTRSEIIRHLSTAKNLTAREFALLTHLENADAIIEELRAEIIEIEDNN